MTTIIFYEKPGCINNTKQKKLLEQAGHSVVAKSLLTEDWSANPMHLRGFFTNKPVSDWFNRSAPAIKEGKVIPQKLTEEQAIILMLEDPLLIRRPLMQVGDEKSVGFEEREIDEWIGLSIRSLQLDLETCPKNHPTACHE